MILLQPVKVELSIRSYYQTILGGSLICDPIIKRHAVGQKRICIVIYITVYNEIAILQNLWDYLQIIE